MGTKVQSLPGNYSMRDLNEESSSCGWPLFYGDKALANGQYYQNHLPSAAADVCSAYDKDVVKQMMLEHEAIFKNQVFELHRLYRIQRDLMDEVKLKELHRNHRSVGQSFSPGPSFLIAGSSACDRPSISGVEGIHSPFGSNKGINKQTCLFPSPNGSSSKDVEILGSRPSKVRRKMFDLHLPADEYIDTDEGEKFSDENASGTTIPDRNCKNGKGGDARLFCGNGGKTGSQEDTSKSEQSLRSRNGLADLNEPIQVEETNAAACIPPLNHNPYPGATECSDPFVKQKSRFFGFSTEDLHNSHYAPSSNGYLKNDGSGKLWISSKETGQAKSSSNPIPQVLKQEQSFFSPQATQDALGKGPEPTSDYLNNRSKTGLWREKTVGGLDISERNKHPENVVSSHSPGLFAFAPSTDFAKSWSQSSWQMASTSLNQKLMSGQMPPSPFLNSSGALNRSSQSHQSNGILGDSWPLNINTKQSAGFHREASVQNGFNPRVAEHFNNGSANYNKSSNLICNEMTSGKDINLNVRLSNGLSNDLVTQSGLGIVDREQKNGEQLAVLPWLRSKTTCKNETQNAGSDRRVTAGELSFLQVASSSNKNETGKGSSEKFMNSVTSGLCSNVVELSRIEASDSCSKKKILGVPIFGVPLISTKESPSLISPSVSVPSPSGIELVENSRKNRGLDINLPCDADVLEVDMDKQAVTETIVCKEGLSKMEANSRNQFDLNMIMNEDEAFVTTIPAADVRKKGAIDLEAPAVPETDDDAIPEEKQLETPLVSPLGPQVTVEQPQDEFMRLAAEAIVSMSSLCCNQVDDVMSSPSERPLVDPLSWFADVAFSCVDDMQRKLDNSKGKSPEGKGESSSKELDYFEAMTLQLEEVKEEDYMPKPLVPENLLVEEAGTSSLPTRARKGPARRGRQRRDFQRDILPGLTSLSRHEVTEDLQTFGGLMKATGHAWHSGLTRRSSSRNGCGRGRRRSQVPPSPPPPVVTIETCTPLIQQLNNVEVGLDDRSLTGWGKTTRRPRRQRCPAGTPPSIRLT
ncbi:uncharacterized protein LOC127101050 [Lathyrus oleraceus]|uniref:Uncharacterized protein n=1 Tax=Pisum sativum TaxID=3888 RepID=A0A9D4VNR6_PEA|nr:uncharacterized protein LOC127101050 [Pisum sativum]XP_050894319.1 uncharacterized protein LOC127101050 [Pisum sativum]XP_050894320.1 uncharacterized protein LOC127101050 [Pisum sativum]XP_050894321.1 uncharacterized protein LOC127101050 [Pisum sativum]XP_050894322.1 uncharacterized protein LOC127101050 [Pisum sativum]KAI5387358.1 hypothetical protein KIW84_073475 [Pisum sativum]